MVTVLPLLLLGQRPVRRPVRAVLFTATHTGRLLVVLMQLIQLLSLLFVDSTGRLRAVFLLPLVLKWPQGDGA